MLPKQDWNDWMAIVSNITRHCYVIMNSCIKSWMMNDDISTRNLFYLLVSAKISKWIWLSKNEYAISNKDSNYNELKTEYLNWKQKEI